MNTIGVMQMPVGFRYEKTHQLGRPQHEKYSDFWRKHIPMDRAHRAKQFAPFDALDGFDEAIEAKQVQYEPRKEMDEEELNRKLVEICHCKDKVTIRFFVPCRDENNDAYKEGWGRYDTVRGSVSDIDPENKTLCIRGQTICFDDIGDVRTT